MLMNDYEMIFVPSVGSPQAGACCLTISESRGGLFPAVFEMLGYPKRIAIRRGINANEGKIIIEATDDVPGAILVDYDRRKNSFYSKEILNPLKDLIRKQVQGDFCPGIFYTVKGVPAGENAVEFDFRDAVHRVVKGKRGNSSDNFRRRSSPTRSSGHKAKLGSGGGGKTAAFSDSSGFNMPNMAGRIT